MRLHLPDGSLKRADADLSDLTSSSRVGDPYWATDEADVLVVPFSPEPTATERAAIRRRLVSADAVDEARLHRLLGMRSTTTNALWVEWLATELAKYGEV